MRNNKNENQESQRRAQFTFTHWFINTIIKY